MVNNDRIFSPNFIKISLACIMLMSANQIIMGVLPLFMQHLGHAPSVLGIATSLSAFAAMIARPVSGYFADRKSKKMILIVGLFIMIFGILGFELFPFAAAIIIIRIVQGFGVSAVTTAQMAIATDVLPDSQIKKGMAYFTACMTIAFGFGPALGLALIFGDNYFYAWLVGAILFAVAIVIAATITYKNAITRQSMDVFSRSREAPGQQRAIWRYFEKDALKPSIFQMVLTTANAGIIVFIPVYAAEIGITHIGVYFILQAITMFASNILVGNRIYRVKNPLWLLLFSVVCFGGTLAFLSVTTGMITFSIAALLHGIGWGVSTTAVSAIIMSATVPERRGAASATYQISIDTGFFVGSLVCGIVAGILGYRYMYGLLILLPVLAGVMSCMFYVKQKTPTH